MQGVARSPLVFLTYEPEFSGFWAGYWRRPAAYLDEKVRAAMSSFWTIGEVSDGLARLRLDLENGVWEERYGHLREFETLDCGYRLVVAD